MRSLTLHASALSDEEYDLYTRLFTELVVDDDTNPHAAFKPRPDNFFEFTAVGVREARAFLRGRYTDLPTATIDATLKLFSAELAKTDTIKGGQFFAVLRLLSHIRTGAGVDPSLAFVQINPNLHLSRPQSPLKPPPTHPVVPAPPPRPRSLSRRSSVVPDSDGSPDQPLPDTAPIPPSVAKSAPSSPRHGRVVSSSPVVSPKTTPLVSSNPFVQRASTRGSISESVPSTPPIPAKLPPLPPRKPVTLQPPPRHLSVSSAPDLVASTSRKPPPPPPPPLPSTSVSAPIVNLASKTTSLISPLIQTSLNASKIAQRTRKVEENAERETVVHVLRSSEPRPRSVSPTKLRPGYPRLETEPLPPRPPPRRRESTTAMTSMSSTSSGSSRSNSHASDTTVFPAPVTAPLVQTNPFKARAEARQPLSRSPSRPPPLHPDRKANSSGESPETPTNPRIGRSKSLHHSPTIAPPTPPPRRRRPESVQLTPTNSQDGSPFVTPPHTADAPFGSRLIRGGSLSARHRSEVPESSSPLANIQKTFVNLGGLAQPKIESARLKAEAGLSKKGFIPHRNGAREEASLIRERSMEHIELGSDAEVDSGTDDNDRRGRLANGSADARWASREQWRPL